MEPPHESLRINAERLKADFNDLAQIGATPDGGVHRPALSDAHLAARAWFAQRVQADGFDLIVDPAGNHSAILNCAVKTKQSILLGSHLDSVPNGGRFDGALGVLAALEVLRTVQEAGLQLPYNLEAIDFTDEEGTLVGLLGSRALVGALTEAELESPRGGRATLLEGLARAGLTEQGLLAAGRDPARLAAYLELHIEQGWRILRAGVQIGIVSAIVGIASYRLDFIGQADHAGTTLMTDRRDAGLGASAFILQARKRLMADFPDCVANVGQAQFSPGAFNIVPERVSLAFEMRAPEIVKLNRLEKAMLDLAQECAVNYHLNLDVSFLGRHNPAPMSAWIQKAIIESCQSLGLQHISLHSGAGHDAQSLAGLCPSGMIFIPSQYGASHCPREFSQWQDCVNGSNVLLLTILRMASV